MDIKGLKETILMLDAITNISKKIPEKAATLAVNFSKERFVEQSWKDTSKEKWASRSINGNRSKRRRNGAILVGTGRLKRSIRKIQVGSDYAIIGTDVPYAQIHNDGGVVKATATVKTFTKKAYTRKRNGRRENVKSHTVSSHKRTINFKMPKRQFMGESLTLVKRIENVITVEYIKAMRGDKK